MNKIIFSENEVKDIIKLYQNWESCYKIGKKYNVCYSVINRTLRENNIILRGSGDRKTKEEYVTTRKYYFNQRYFENIDSEQKAYWLGFLFADGNVTIRKNKNTGNHKGGVVEIGLKAEDEYQLVNFRKCIWGTQPIKQRDIKLNGKIFKASRILVNSIDMVNDLISHGCVPCKSLILEPPIGVPDELIRHFIRGYFDGDGYLGYYPNNKSCPIGLDFSGNNIFLKWIKETLIKSNITSDTIVKDKRNNVYSLPLFGRDNFKNFYNYIYDDSTYILDRKKEKFRDAMLRFDKEINIGWMALHALQLPDDEKMVVNN